MFTKYFSALDQKFDLIAEKYDQGAISENIVYLPLKSTAPPV